MATRDNDNSNMWQDIVARPPLLSAPYEIVEDCMDAAPECALVWLNREGSYQHTESDCKHGFRQIIQLARGNYELSDLSLIAWRNRGFWESFGE
jgi:hypothetical protein